jgi:hypothetical protein
MAQGLQTRCTGCRQYIRTRPELDDYEAEERAYTEDRFEEHFCSMDYDGGSWAPREGEEEAYFAGLAAEVDEDIEVIDEATEVVAEAEEIIEQAAAVVAEDIEEETDGATGHLRGTGIDAAGGSRGYRGSVQARRRWRPARPGGRGFPAGEAGPGEGTPGLPPGLMREERNHAGAEGAGDRPGGIEEGRAGASGAEGGRGRTRRGRCQGEGGGPSPGRGPGGRRSVSRWRAGRRGPGRVARLDGASGAVGSANAAPSDHDLGPAQTAPPGVAGRRPVPSDRPGPSVACSPSYLAEGRRRQLGACIGLHTSLPAGNPAPSRPGRSSLCVPVPCRRTPASRPLREQDGSGVAARPIDRGRLLRSGTLTPPAPPWPGDTVRRGGQEQRPTQGRREGVRRSGE